MLDAIERFLYWFGSVTLQGDGADNVQLRAPVDGFTFSTSGDDLISGIEILGSKTIIGQREYEEASSNLAKKLSQRLRTGDGKQHSIGIAFRSSPESTGRLVTEILSSMRATAKRYGALEDLVDDIQSTLTSRCVDESVYLVLVTHRGGLTPSEGERAKKWREETHAKMVKTGGYKRVRDEFGQNPRTPPPALFPRHETAMNRVVDDLQQSIDAGGVGLLVRRLTYGELGALMRRQVDASPFPRSWRVLGVGEKLASAHVSNPRSGDASDLVPMSIGRQIVQKGFKESFDGLETAQSGAYHYGSIVLEVMPRSGDRPFNELVDKIGREIPWAVGFEIIGNGKSSRGIDKFYSSLVGGFGAYNKSIKRAWDHLNSIGDVSALRCVFTTWARTRDKCIENVEFLKSAVEGWDSAIVTNETGSPAHAVLATAAGMTKFSPAPYIPGPIDSVARVLPVFRPASLWKEGHLIAHTLDGRPYPIMVGAKEQAFWGLGVLAPSGRGKSTMLSALNLGLAFGAGQTDLPYITVVDAGESSKYAFDLGRELLPKRLADQITHVKVSNSPKYCVNPMDTQLGADRLLPAEMDFAVQVVLTIAPNLGPEAESFVRVVIQEAFNLLGRKSPERRVWDPTWDKEAHQCALETGLEYVEGKTRVWDVVDHLFSKRRINESARAQRFAVPVLVDLIEAARSRTVTNMYGSAKVGNDELMVDVFQRNVLAAQQNYALVAGPTQHDIGTARIVSIDLSEVLGSVNTEEGRRRSGLMYLLARRIGARNYFLHLDDIKGFFPALYEAYHVNRIKVLQESLKLLCYDEKHYTTGVKEVDKQIGIDMRTGRKYKVITAMLSQMLADFTPEMVGNMYTTIILGAQTVDELDQIQATFGLSRTERDAIKDYCTGRGRMFVSFVTDHGRVCQILQNPQGPLLGWGITTGASDVPLRRELSQRLGHLGAIKALAKIFPGGSAQGEIDRYKQELGSDAGRVDSRPIVEVFAEKVLKEVDSRGLRGG